MKRPPNLRPLASDNRCSRRRLPKVGPRLLAVLTAALAILCLGAGNAAANPVGYDLAHKAGIKIFGDAGDTTGYSVASAGDVDGDGIPDTVIGAPFADKRDKRKNNGAAYIVYGRKNRKFLDLAVITSSFRGVRVDGAKTGDQAGWSVGGGGDLNGDGFDDVLVGAPRYDYQDRKDAGAVYVIWGGPRRPNPGAIDLKDPQGLTSVIGGRQDGDFVGYSVAYGQDQSGDGHEEALIGAPRGDSKRGSAYVVFSKAGDKTGIDLANAPTDRGYRVEGSELGAQFGTSIAGAGYMNGDTKGEMIVGARLANGPKEVDNGAAYVVYGRNGGDRLFTGSMTIADGFKIVGAKEKAHAGTSVANVGDINGDGSTDVAVGAPDDGTLFRPGAGMVGVVFGQSQFFNVDLRGLGTLGYRIKGAESDDKFGYSVAPAGDINDDGIPDLIGGAPSAGNPCRGGSGSAYVVYGREAGRGVRLDRFDADLGLRIDGSNGGDRLGWSVAGVKDAQDDGRQSVMVGANDFDFRNRGFAGVAYILDRRDPRRTLPIFRKRLPIKFDNKPGGFAKDYEGFLSVKIRSIDAKRITNVFGFAYRFGGSTAAFAKLGRPLTSRSQFLNLRLKRPLVPGGYTVIVSGTPDQHRFCGPKTRQIVLKFK